MKKVIAIISLMLFILSAYSLEVVLDLNQNTGNEPLDVNLTATILDGIQTRICTELNACGTENSKPEEIQSCGLCINGTSFNCTAAQNCNGTRTCTGGAWGECIDTPNDNCPLDANITVKQIIPTEDINIVQNQLFTFTSSVTCNNADCGNITATLDPIKEEKSLNFINLSDEIKNNYTIKNNTFVRKEKDYETEIGKINDLEFIPEIKIKKWNNETSFSAKLIDKYSSNQSIKLQGNTPSYLIKTEGKKIKYVKDEFEVHFYEKEKNNYLFEEGGFELEVLLKEKPESNIVEFQIETKNLEFLYQPPLNQETSNTKKYNCTSTYCLDETGKKIMQRPENIVGSYAAYYTKKKNNQYKTGKAFHIYRPKITDAEDNWTWGKLNINEKKEKLTLTIPQDFLDKAVYPILVDPTFGYTNGGASQWGVSSNHTYANQFTTNNFQSGKVNSITAYMYDNWYDVSFKFGYYNDTGTGLPETLQNKSGLSHSTGGLCHPCWITLDVNGDLNANTDYWLASWAGSNGHEIRYDSDATKPFKVSNATGEFPNNDIWAWESGNNIASIYLTYTDQNNPYSTIKLGERSDADFFTEIPDTYIDGSNKSNNYGFSDVIQVREAGNEWRRRGLIKFNLNNIPEGLIIANATLKLTVKNFDADVINVHAMLADWQEGNQNGAAGTTNWNELFTGASWTDSSPGNEHFAQNLLEAENTIIDSVTNIPNEDGYVISFNITNAVQRWIAGQIPNYGLFLDNNNTQYEGDTSFYSSEANNELYRPLIVIEYLTSGVGIKEVVPMNAGNPFYTTSQNPQTCMDMNTGDTCINTWQVMPTGNTGNAYSFFVDYVPTDTNITSKETPIIKITIGAGETCADNDTDGFNGYNAGFCYSGLDCNDTNSNINPNSPEICSNGIDDNCNNEIDEGCIVACTENWDCGNWSQCSSGVSPYVFEWDFEGDGTTDQITNSPKNWMIYTYLVGIHNPKIKVTDIANANAEDSKTINVASASGNSPPIADAGGPYFGVPGENIVLDANASFDSDGTIDQYKWKITDKKGNTNCSPSNIVSVNPTATVSCNGIGTADVNLTVRDNGSPNREWATTFTTIKINQTQTSDLINIVKMEVKPEIVKTEDNLQITVKVENATNDAQTFNIYFEIKENKSDENISQLPNNIPNLELLNQQVLPFSQGEGRKEFVLTIPAASLANLESQKNYWIYATAETAGESNTTFNTRRTTFNYRGKILKPLNLLEINFINIAVVLLFTVFILTKKKKG